MIQYQPIFASDGRANTHHDVTSAASSASTMTPHYLKYWTYVLTRVAKYDTFGVTSEWDIVYDGKVEAGG